MIELGFRPIIRRVAVPAAFAVQALVLIFFAVTCVAVCRRIFELIIGVAAGTCSLGVLADERIVGFTLVIEFRVDPLGCLVATITLGSEAAFVLIIVFMAINALRRCLSEFFRWDMAIFAFNFRVRVD